MGGYTDEHGLAEHDRYSIILRNIILLHLLYVDYILTRQFIYDRINQPYGLFRRASKLLIFSNVK